MNGKLLISGGVKTGKPKQLKSSELVSSEVIINGPDLAEQVSGHCNIKVNETVILITGGYNGYKISNRRNSYQKTTFLNVKTGQVVPGPKLKERRYIHRCATFQFKGKTFALVAYGHHSSSVEILDLDDTQNGWKVIPKTRSEPKGQRSSFQIVVLNETDVFIVGGIHKHLKAIYKLDCKNDEIENCEWKKLEQSLKYGRNRHVAFAIPDSLANELCNEK